MDISKLTRDSVAVAATLQSMPNDSLVTKSGCTIQIPSRYVDKQLATLSKQGTYILGIFALITPDGKYSVFNFPNMVRIAPAETRRFIVDGIEYIEFEFSKGSAVLSDMNVLVQDTLIYNLYDYYIDGGVMPWFMTYRDVCSVFDLVDEYIGVQLGARWTVIKAILGQIGRQQGDKTKKYRELLKDNSSLTKVFPTYVAFSSIMYGPKTTSGKLMGPYFDTALVSAIVNPSVASDNIETYYRS